MGIVNRAMDALSDSLNKPEQKANLLDTVAWYYYQRFRAGSAFGGKVADLEKAKYYASRMWDQRASTSAVYLMEALEGRKNRLQEILYAQVSEFDGTLVPETPPTQEA